MEHEQPEEQPGWKYLGRFSSPEELIWSLPDDLREHIGQLMRHAATRDENNRPVTYTPEEQERRITERMQWWIALNCITVHMMTGEFDAYLIPN